MSHPLDIQLPMFGGLVHIRIQTTRPVSPGTWDRMVRALGLLRSVCSEDADAGCASCGRPYGDEHGFRLVEAAREFAAHCHGSDPEGGKAHDNLLNTALLCFAPQPPSDAQAGDTEAEQR